MRQLRFVFAILLSVFWFSGCSDQNGPIDPEINRQLGIEDVAIDPCTSCVGIYLSGDANSWNTCYVAPGGDGDTDHIDDSCEAQLAAAFAPELAFSYTDDDISRETYWAVGMSDDPTLNQTLRIFYALGYHSDTGLNPYQHEGDSEFVELHVRFDPTLTTGGTSGRWVLQKALLSAHWKSSANRTGYYNWDQFRYPTGSRDHPRIWVAEDNHANYKSSSDCWSVITPEDVCSEDTPLLERASVVATRNLGSQWAQFINCTYSSQPTVYTGIECFWNRTDTFAGWYGNASGVEPYGQILYDFSWFLGSEY